MRHELNIWVIGGDLRQAKLAQLLAQDGHTVHTYALGEPQEPASGLYPEAALDHLDRADCVVLPLPVTGETGLLNAPLALSQCPLEPILDRLSPGPLLCGGRVAPQVQALAQARGLTIHDYFAREELAVANAVPTALMLGHSLGTKCPLILPDLKEHMECSVLSYYSFIDTIQIRQHEGVFLALQQLLHLLNLYPASARAKGSNYVLQ